MHASDEPVVGIDLGTTNSCIAVFRDGKPCVIPNKGHLTTPSVVAVTASGKLLVGHQAKRQAVTNAEHTVYALKRLIGRAWNAPETQSSSLLAAYVLTEGPHADVRVELRDKCYSLPQLSALILQQLKRAADDFLGVPVKRAVITVPAYFNDHQRQATRDAGEIAGLEVLRIINEPTAAALAFGVGRPADQRIAIYDLGGGTFDISVVRVRGGDFEVLATGGDSFLGGEDFDARIIDWLIAGVLDDYGIDLRSDRTALQRLKDAAETAKRTLSAASSADIELPFVAQREGGEPVHLTRTLARTTFEELTSDLVARTLDKCHATLREAGLAARDIDEVVLVGGMSRMPLVDAEVRRLFGRGPSNAVHPDEAVALGAALHAQALSSPGAAPANLRDVTSLALGLKDAREHFDELIAKNTPVPTSQSHVFTTSYDDQSFMNLVLLQGGAPAAADNELLGEFTLEGLRPGRRGSSSVVVTIAIDEQGLVSVSARDRDTGAETSLRVTARSGLTREEVETMAESAGVQAAEDRRAEEHAAALQGAEKLATEVDRLLGNQRERLANNPIVAEAESLVAMARDAIRAGDAADATMAALSLGAVKRDLEARSGR